MLKTHDIDFEKEEGHCNLYRRLNLSSLHNSTYFLKVVALSVPFLYV